MASAQESDNLAIGYCVHGLDPETFAPHTETDDLDMISLRMRQHSVCPDSCRTFVPWRPMVSKLSSLLPPLSSSALTIPIDKDKDKETLANVITTMNPAELPGPSSKPRSTAAGLYEAPPSTSSVSR